MSDREKCAEAEEQEEKFKFSAKDIPEADLNLSSPFLSLWHICESHLMACEICMCAGTQNLIYSRQEISQDEGIYLIDKQMNMLEPVSNEPKLENTRNDNGYSIYGNKNKVN